jgi:aspartate aminotransferase
MPSVKTYRYYHKETRGLDFEGMMEDLGNATEGSCIMFHTCAHNPTGVDPSFEQWKQIAEVCKARKLYPFFDTAYQGFVTGDLGKDGAAMRYFVDQGFEMCIAQSFAKILGVYGERIGACHFITGSKEVATAVLSHLKASIRVNWSSPPLHGGRVAALILNNEEKRASWLAELVTVTDRIAVMRIELHKALLENKCPGSWDHVVNQIGMFTFTGLTPAQCG